MNNNKKLIAAIFLWMTSVIGPAAYAFTPLTFSGPPVVNGTGSAGTTALWTNVGQVNGVDLDMVIYVVSNNRSTLDFLLAGDNARVVLDARTAQEVQLEYRFYRAGTFGTALEEKVTLIPKVLFQDIDLASNETVRIEQPLVAGYTLENPTDLTVATVGNALEVTSSADGTGTDTNIAIRFDLQPMDTIPVTFSKSNRSGRYFEFDGNIDLVFSNPDTTSLDTTHPAIPTVDSQTTTDFTPTLTGTAEAFTTVTVDVGGATFTTVATGSGTWSIDTGAEIPASGVFNPNTNGVNEVVVTSTDAAGNSRADITTNELVIGTDVPGVPTVVSQITNDTTPVIIGTAGVGTTLSVSVAGAIYAPTVDGSGNWSIDTGTAIPASGTFSPNVNGANEVVVTSTDGGGGVSSDTTSNELVIDTTPPTLSIDDNGSGGDDIYNDAEDNAVVVSGSTNAEAGQPVTVGISDGVNTVSTTAAVQTGGAWTAAAADISSLEPGSIVITADVDDAAGNPATRVSNTATLDNGLPALTASNVGPTHDTTPMLSGTTDQPAGRTVTVTDNTNATICTAIVVAGTPDNTWGCTPTTPIAQGTYTFTAAIDSGTGRIRRVDFTVSVDFDADDDGIPDVLEGTTDTDGDGLPDYQDPDADNDGIPDGDEDTAIPPLTGNDSDGDGIDDAIDVDNTGGVDANGDGIDDAIRPADLDGDGIPNHLDGDSDGDGIPDILEGVVDTDHDGSPDYLDVDSDNDGIPDRIENTSTPALSGEDSDADGIDNAIDVDNTGGRDANGNGIDDALEPTDSDADGTPDHLDRDSDNDGIPDVIEADNLLPLTGTDSDQDGIDDSLDVDATGGADANGDGVDDARAPKDSDLDGTPDYLDRDSDGDGILDNVEGGASGTDTDADGIDDAFDVDQTGGVDSDADGVDDAGAPDTDGDGVADYRDLDSDNDGRPDVTEAGLTDENGDGRADNGATTDTPRNTDATDVPDYLDPDSDNDGTLDIVGTDANAFDTDGDGRIDDAYATDTDGDGVPDVIDGEPTTPGIGADRDSDDDGVPNARDLDDDNDGIPDAVEAPNGIDIDSDGDGIVNRLDLDSDNDGLPDTLEGEGNRTRDRDADGRLDDMTDANLDGLADSVSPDMQPVDTDADGAPDYIDIDSDADGISDLAESTSNSQALDSDSDGVLDAQTDVDADGLMDVVDTSVTGGTNGTALSPPDSDGDGLLNYRDKDSDGDGYDDALENGDFNGDGIRDNLQDTGELETAVTGTGSTGLLSLIMLAGFAAFRQLRRGLLAVVLLAGVVAGSIFPGSALADNLCGRYVSDVDAWLGVKKDFNDCWYVAGGLGLTRIDPEGEANGWHTVDDSSDGFKLILGYHFSPHWFGELSYTDAGEASLDNLNPAIAGEPGITYKIPSLFGGYWLRGPEKDWNVYAKLGLSSINNDVTDNRVPFDKQSSVQLAGGVGIQWRFASRWFVRLEHDTFDRDANYTGLSLGTYLGRSAGQTQEPSPAPQHAPVTPVPVSEPEPIIPATQPPIADCKAFSGTIEGVQFVTNSAELTLEAEQILGETAKILQKYSDIQLEVQAHTDSDGPEDYNLKLSQERAKSVVSFLVSKGVAAGRLSARGYGETRPVASNATWEGRAENRRVEFVVLNRPDCNDAEQ